MGSRSDLFLAYKETRVSLESASSATIVHARVPTVSGSRRIVSDTWGTSAFGGAAASGGSSRRDFASGGGSGISSDTTDDERAYRFKTLASESGIIHRKHHNGPRSFMWRVLERGTVLSLRSVDVVRTKSRTAATTATETTREALEGSSSSFLGADTDAVVAADAPLTLYLHFAKPIRPGCVAFADPPQHDALTVFVLDESSYLHYLQLRSDVFRKRPNPASGNKTDLGEAWAPYLSATFNFKQPRRLVAVSANEFVTTLNDGGLINFRCDHAHSEGFSWREQFYSPVGLIQGLRSILPFQGGSTIKYEGTHLEVTASTSATVSSMDLDGVAFLFSVCLDHRLRVWNLARGEVCYTGDILGLHREPHEQAGKWTIDPGQTNLLRIFDLGEGVSGVVTYSPIGAGAFKFWKATATADGHMEIATFDEMGVEEPLQPPTPSVSDVWTLADFAVAYDAESHTLSLWVLWKNNLVYRVMQLACAPDRLASAWDEAWVGVYTESSGSAPTAPTSGPSEPTDAAEKWLDLIFPPGRFSKATLETALSMYERGLGATRKGSASNNGSSNVVASTSSDKSLMEAICSVLGSTATLEQGPSGAMDYDLFRSASEIQWRRFYRLLVELDKQRTEALSLVLDTDNGLAWVVCTDCVAAIRECSALERIYHNSPNNRTLSSSSHAQYEKVARLLSAGTTLVDSFSDGMLHTCEAALRSELFDDTNDDSDGIASSSRSDEERMQLLSDRAGFWRHLTDDECAQVADILGGDVFPDVDAATYDTLLELLEDVQQQRGADVRFPFTQFGHKVVLRGLQDTSELLWQILFRQLILLVHMEFEVDDERNMLHARLDVGRVYSRLIAALKRLELVKWLGRTEFSVALSKSERESRSLLGSFSGSVSASGLFNESVSHSSNRRPGGAEDTATQVVTALEGTVGHLLGLRELSGDTPALSASLTAILVDVCSARSSIVLDAAAIQCMLLKRERADLAFQLSAFAISNPFSTYIQGRTFLALQDYDTASVYFKRAAVGLSTFLRNPDRHSSGLIDATEWNQFYSGLPNYYAHIVSLYDSYKAFSFVIDFARLSLQFVRGDVSRLSVTNGSDSKESGSRKGSAVDQIENTVESLSATRTEMLSRLFNAAAALSRLETAYSALVSMGQPLPGQGSVPTTTLALQRSCLRLLIEKMCESGQVAALLALPFSASLHDAMDDILEQKCRGAVDIVRSTPVPWHQILYAWRIAHNDYRGAASVLMDRLQKLQQAGQGDKFAASAASMADLARENDVLDTPVTRQYLLLINTLSCVEPKQAWVYVEEPTQGGGSGSGSFGNVASRREGSANDAAPAKRAVSGSAAAMTSFLQKAAAAQRPPWRKVVTLADLRKQYQAELDRIAAIQNNQFAFGAANDEEDITMKDL